MATQSSATPKAMRAAKRSAAIVTEERREERRQVTKSLEEEVRRLARQWGERYDMLRDICDSMKWALSVAAIRVAAFKPANDF